MAGRKIEITFLGNNRDLDRAMDTSAKKSGRFGSALKSAGKMAAVGLGVGAVIAGKALFDMTKGAIEDEAAQKRLALALKNNTGATKDQVASVEDWITAQGKAFGVTDDELRPALEKLVGATKDVGEAQKLAKLAMDISAGSGKSLEQVTTALMKAQNGSAAGLARLGIKVKDSEKDTVALKAAQIALTDAQTKHSEAVAEFGPKSKEARDAAADLEYRQMKLGEANEKTKTTTIDFAEAQKRLADQFGGAAADKADTLQGKMARLKLIMSEAGETIGAKLIPVVTRMADWFLKKGLPAISRFSAYLREKVPPIFEKIRAVVSKVMGAFKGDVSGNLGKVKQTFQDFVSIAQSIWKRFGGTLTAFAKGTFANIKTIVSGAFKVIRGIFKLVSSLLKGDWKGMWSGIKMIASGAAGVLKGVVKQLFNYMKTVFKLAGTALKGIMGGIWDGLKSLVAKGVGSIIDAIKSVPGRIKALAGMYRDAGKFLINGLIDGLKNAGSFVSDIAGNIWDAVKGMLNAAITKINAALEFTINTPGPGGITVNPPNIPALERGGVVKATSGGTLALIGEGGHDEAVVPLSGPHAPRMGGDVHVHFHQPVAGDPRAFARAVRTELLKEKRLVGGNLGLA